MTVGCPCGPPPKDKIGMSMYYKKDKRTDEDDCTMIEDDFGKDMQVTSGRAAKGKDSTREISSQVNIDYEDTSFHRCYECIPVPNILVGYVTHINGRTFIAPGYIKKGNFKCRNDYFSIEIVPEDFWQYLK